MNTTLNSTTGEGSAPRVPNYKARLANGLELTRTMELERQRDELLVALKDIDAIADFMRAQLVKASQFTHADQAVEIRLTIKRAIAKAEGTISG